jgi:hypothetical protein
VGKSIVQTDHSSSAFNLSLAENDYRKRTIRTFFIFISNCSIKYPGNKIKDMIRSSLEMILSYKRNKIILRYM